MSKTVKVKLLGKASGPLGSIDQGGIFECADADEAAYLINSNQAVAYTPPVETASIAPPEEKVIRPKKKKPAPKKED